MQLTVHACEQVCVVYTCVRVYLCEGVLSSRAVHMCIVVCRCAHVHVRVLVLPPAALPPVLTDSYQSVYRSIRTCTKNYNHDGLFLMCMCA